MTKENGNEGRLPTFPEPYWLDNIEIPQFGSLKDDLEVDVVIVGGGITGITAAYLLLKEGVKVAVLEAGKLLNGTTGHTTAKITAQHDLIYDEFINHFGKEKARLYYQANTEALNFIKKMVNELAIDCNFTEQDAVLYATSEKYARELEKEYQAYQELGIDSELKEEIPFNIEIENALHMKNQAQFHPLKYLTHLVHLIKKAGGLIFENTTAVNVEENEQGAVVLTREGKRVTADYILACSHFPFYEGTGLYSTRMYADRSYLLAVKTEEDYPGGMYLSVDQPSRSLRSAAGDGENIVLIAGEGHKTGQGKDTLEHYKALEAFSQKVFHTKEIMYRWSAQDLTTLDKMPYIGAITSTQQKVLVATGFRKWGMSSGTVAAKLLSDIVLERDNPYKDLYTPSRFIGDPSVKEFIKENADVAKHLIKGKLDLPVQRIHDLSEDQGAPVTIEGKRKGAYRDKQGKVYIVDTTCTHMGCEVNWNHGDRTWDCPCHGSRFSYTGEVVEGPAEKPLQRDEHTFLDNITSEDSGY
ncbi:FAD-dependent oxidoreductase [Sediminibacillus albus]|uniref:Glycine/D-amino acid oxidase n=1 Tax=Sediminibacillus albus TaxID=407036 RepID=A0A1G8WQP6_9BACI|nr:FAD-dependent oxidoreductase [Sediminibacillus albus]SDJ80406.1 Glycine/D-amino acid oxidase [Sediminibacillus albus]